VEAAAVQRRIEAQSAQDLIEEARIWGVTIVASPDEVATMEAVCACFRSHLVGRAQVRDWKLLFLLANGLTYRQAGRVMGCSHALAGDRKKLQCDAIARGVSSLLPTEARVAAPW